MLLMANLKKCDHGHFPSVFPRLEPTNWRAISPFSSRYNCAAQAVGDKENHWWPQPWMPPPNSNLWFRGCSRKDRLEDFAEGFATLGYKETASVLFAPGVIRLAVYAIKLRGEWSPQHIARQIPSLNGWWHSRIGRQCCDIAHTLDAISGNDLRKNQYGEVRLILERRATAELRALERLARMNAVGGPSP
jgi:hypothetical protein